MSGRDQPQNQGNQQPQGQQGGQPQGGQPQGGQPPQGRQPPQGGQQQPPGGRQQPPGGPGGRPPGGGGGSPLDALREPEPKRYLVGIVGMFVFLAVAAFLVIALVGAVGGPPLTNDQFEELEGDEKSQQAEERQNSLKRSLVSSAMTLAPFGAIGITGLAGVVVGRELNRPQNDVLVTAAAAAFAGAFLFYLLTVFLTSTQLPSDMQLSTLGGDSVAFVPLLIDSVLIGIVSAIAAVGGAYLGTR